MPKYTLVVRKCEMHEVEIEAISAHAAIQIYYNSLPDTRFIKPGTTEVIYCKQDKSPDQQTT